MSLLIRYEKYAFYLLILGIIFSILSGTGIGTPILKWIIFPVNIILGLYFFPLLVYARNSITINKGNKNVMFILSSFLLMQTCTFIALVQIVQVEPIMMMGKIVAFLNGLCFIACLIMGKNYNILFSRHFVVNTLLMALIIIAL
jgi:hypothetical protein